MKENRAFKRTHLFEGSFLKHAARLILKEFRDFAVSVGGLRLMFAFSLESYYRTYSSGDTSKARHTVLNTGFENYSGSPVKSNPDGPNSLSS